MLKIRLQRVGRKHEPTFRVVVTDSKNSTKSGRILEVVGAHDPRHKVETLLKTERIKHWMNMGAKPTGTLHNMFIDKGLVKGKKINVLPKKTSLKKEKKVIQTVPPASTTPRVTTEAS